MINNNEWKKMWSKRYSIRLAENWLYSVREFGTLYGVDFPRQKIVIDNRIGIGFLHQKELKFCLEQLFKKVTTSSFDFFEKTGLRILGDFENRCKHISNLRLHELSNKEIVEVFKHFLQQEDKWMNVLWFIFILDEFLSDKLQTSLKNNGLNRYLEIITHPYKKTAALLYKVDLLKLAKDSKNLTLTQVNVEITKITQKYSYFSILNMDEEPLQEPYFREQLKNIIKSDYKSELSRIENSFSKNQKKYDALIKTIEDRELLLLMKLCRKVAYYREYRNDCRQRSYYYARSLYKEIARRLHIDVKDVIFLQREEIIASLQNDNLIIAVETLAKRKKYSVLTMLDGRVTISHSRMDIDSNIIAFEEIRGIVVGKFPRIRGPVKIIRDIQKDIAKITEGDILVTTTTNLSFIPVFSKVVAIIAEEGGMLSHTAVVARELNIPCIVGTGIATQILKDGDIVEIDSEDGLISKQS